MIRKLALCAALFGARELLQRHIGDCQQAPVDGVRQRLRALRFGFPP